MNATNDVTPGLAPDFTAVKSRQQNTWASGDFSVVASRIVFQAEHLCEIADLQVSGALPIKSTTDRSLDSTYGRAIMSSRTDQDF